MATATAESSASITFTLLPKVNDAKDWLRRYNAERDDVIDLLWLSALSGVDMLFLGLPGVGKTYAIELMVNHCLTDMELFTHLLAKDQSADETLGPKSLSALKEDKIRRMIEGMMPEANFAYLDEFFKASPPTLNPMLDVMATRKLKVGGEVIECDQLVSIIMSSNELPRDREDLSALRDRIGLTYQVKPVETPDGWRRVLDIQCDLEENGFDLASLSPLTLDEVNVIREEVRAVKLPDTIRDTLVKALERFQKAGHLPSMRRLGQMRKMAKANAWLNKRSEVASLDLHPLMHMAWNDLDHAHSSETIITDFLGEFARKAQLLRESLEPVLVAMSELKIKVENAGSRTETEELMESGRDFLRELREIRDQAETVIAEGQSQGQDVGMVQTVLDEVNKTYKWAWAALTGSEES